MKRYLLVPLLTVLAGTTAWSADEPEAPQCEAVKSSAQSVMLMHQRGIPEKDQIKSYRQILHQKDLNKAQERAYAYFKDGLRMTFNMHDENKAIKALVSSAYKQPRHDDKADQKAAVDQFTKKTYERCMAARDKDNN